MLQTTSKARHWNLTKILASKMWHSSTQRSCQSTNPFYKMRPSRSRQASPRLLWDPQARVNRLLSSLLKGSMIPWKADKSALTGSIWPNSTSRSSVSQSAMSHKSPSWSWGLSVTTYCSGTPTQTKKILKKPWRRQAPGSSSTKSRALTRLSAPRASSIWVVGRSRESPLRGPS